MDQDSEPVVKERERAHCISISSEFVRHVWKNTHVSDFPANRTGRRIDELISEFSPSKITTHSALLDLDKLPEFNR